MVDKGDAFPGTMGLTSWLHSNYISRGSGGESFQKEAESRWGRRASCSAGNAMLTSLLKQNMNANISSANRRGALETLGHWGIHPHYFMLPGHGIKCYCSRTCDMLICSLVFKKVETLGGFAALPPGFRKDLESSTAAQRSFWGIGGVCGGGYWKELHVASLIKAIS